MNETTFQYKIAAARTLLASKGLWRASYAPTVVAFLWRMGVEIPPPHFVGFFGNFAFSSVLFGSVWGALMWLLWWSSHGTSPIAAAATSAIAGLVAGLCIASYYHYSAHKYSIPRWDEFAPSTAQ
jgi:hypothetical protein